jgi:hypothetical protein
MSAAAGDDDGNLSFGRDTAQIGLTGLNASEYPPVSYGSDHADGIVQDGMP